MGTQLGVAIALGVFGGLKLDERMAWNQPLGTAIGGLLGLGAGLYLVVRALK
jgi:F0F1-type ATP synthase assembly protein I